MHHNIFFPVPLKCRSKLMFKLFNATVIFSVTNIFLFHITNCIQLVISNDLLILWLSFFCLSRTSAIETSPGSCFMRISSASSFSNFNASSNELESRFNISSIKSFDCISVIAKMKMMTCGEGRDRERENFWHVISVIQSHFYGSKSCFYDIWFFFCVNGPQWQITLFWRRRAFKL